MHAAPVHPIIRIIQNHSHHSSTLAFHIHPCHNMTQKANASAWAKATRVRTIPRDAGDFPAPTRRRCRVGGVKPSAKSNPTEPTTELDMCCASLLRNQNPDLG